jgi:hypothetical protein
VLRLLAPIALLLGTLVFIRIRERHLPHAKAAWVRLALKS